MSATRAVVHDKWCPRGEYKSLCLCTFIALIKRQEHDADFELIAARVKALPGSYILGHAWIRRDAVLRLLEGDDR